MALWDLDLAAAAKAAAAQPTRRRQSALRDDDGGSGLAPHFLELFHRALDRLARERAEFLRRLLERGGADLECDRKRAGRRKDLRFAGVKDRARSVACAVFRDGRHAPDGADAPIGEHFLQIQRGRIELDFVLFGFGSHVNLRKEFASVAAAARAASRRRILSHTGSTHPRSGSRTSPAIAAPAPPD